MTYTIVGVIGHIDHGKTSLVAALTGVAGTVEIDDPACAAVSYPTFWTDMEHLAA